MLVKRRPNVWKRVNRQSVGKSTTVLPWLLPEFVATEQCSEMVKTDILNLSKDPDTFLQDIEGSEDAKYSPSNNTELINLLRNQDPRLKQARFLFVQRDAKIDVETVGS